MSLTYNCAHDYGTNDRDVLAKNTGAWSSSSRNYLTKQFCNTSRGVMRLDGARGKKQVWCPMFEPEGFRKKMHCIEEGTVCTVKSTWL